MAHSDFSIQPSSPTAWTQFRRGRSPLIVVLALTALLLGACLSLLPPAGPVRTPVVLPTGVSDRPQIAISPPSGYAGVYVQVAGNGWPPNELVLIALSDETGRSGILAASAANSNGQVTTGFLYPISPRWLRQGAQTVVAYTADGNLQASAVFEVIPSDGVTPVAAIQSPTPTTTPSSLTQTPTAQPASSSTVTATPSPTATPTPPPTPIVITDWRGEYWANSTLSGEPALVRNDTAVFFDWGSGPPASSLPADQFSARWTRELNFDAGVYQFFLEMDDGARLFIDDRLVVDEWQAGSRRIASATAPLTAGRHTLRVEYFERTGQALARFWWERQVAFTGWEGRYYTNPNLQGEPAVVRDDAAINFDWGMGNPAAGIAADNFSVRWRRTVNFAPGRYRFYARMDDGLRIRIDGQLLLDEWQDGPDRTVATDVELPGGNYQIEVEYYEKTGGALAGFWWEIAPEPTPTHTPSWTPTPTATQLPSATPTATPEPTSTSTATPEPTVTPSWTPTQEPPTETPTPTTTATIETAQGETVTATATATAQGEADNGTPTPVAETPEIGETVPFTHMVFLSLAPPRRSIYQVITSEDAWVELLESLRPLRAPRPAATRPIPGERAGTPTPSPIPPSSNRPIAPGQITTSLIPDFSQEIVIVAILGMEQAGDSVQIVDVRQEGDDLFVKMRILPGQTGRAALGVIGVDAVVVQRDFVSDLDEMSVYFVDESYGLLGAERIAPNQ